MSDARPAVYDPVELRRRIVVCFSVGELRALAESVGAGGIAWERGIDQAAREVVRQCERYAGLPALVARLREMRPLVEWPEPAEDPAALVSAPAPPATGAAAGLRASIPPLSASPGSLGGPSQSPLMADPYAPPAGPPAIRLPSPVAGAPPSAGWPGVTEPTAASSRAGVDPRIFVAAAALMVVAASIAYLAGRASSTVATPEATPDANAASPTRAARGAGPAAVATDALARSYANMARVCELPASAGNSELVFRRVYERCGPSPLPRRASSPAPAAPLADANRERAPTADPAPRGRRGGRGDAAPGEPAPAAKGCMRGACEAQHGACRGRCGPEPTEGSAYDGYQRCMGRCLSDASHCRLTCR